jgi:hypothetical protein
VQDRPKLEEYMSSIRDVEQRIAQGGTPTTSTCAPPAKPSNGVDSPTQMSIFIDLISLGFQCDVTRVISFQWGNVVSERDYTFIGAQGGHHALSHHFGNTEMIEKIKLIDRWQIEQLAALIAKLKSLPDADGKTVLDNTTIFYSSDVSDGDSHNHNDMPVIVAGHGAGFTMGRHMQYTDGKFFGNLFVSIANAYGLSLSEFGERGQGALTDLV